MAKEQAKIAPLQKKIISAKGAISRTKSQSTIKSKLNEIERAEKSISDIQKKSPRKKRNGLLRRKTTGMKRPG